MKKILFFLIFTSNNFAQIILSQNFDNVTTVGMPGWTFINSSNPVGTSIWAQGDNVTYLPANDGVANAYAGSDFNTTGQLGTISNWLLTPTAQLDNGNVIKFYTYKGNTVTDPDVIFPDRLQVRLNKNNGANPNPSLGAEDLGGFTDLLLDINPTLTTTGYPLNWTEYTIVISGLSGPTNCKIGFRHYVTDGGSGASAINSEYVGIDTFSIDRNLSVHSVLSSKFNVFPNPVEDILTIEKPDYIDIEKVAIIDMNGRMVKNFTSISNGLNLSDLKTGIYFLNIETPNGIASKRVLKK